MNAQDNTHLTNEQFTDLLLGIIPPPVTTHLDACAQCAEEAQRVSGAIGSFEQQSRLWAERRAATHPLRESAHQPAFAWLNRPVAWSAAAAALAIATILGVAHKSEPAIAVQQFVAPLKAAPATVTPATLKADNALLSAIDGELSAQSAPPASLYGLKIDTHAPHTRSFKRMSN